MPISPTGPHPLNGDSHRDYLFDMIAQLAALARRSGETIVAIHLEAILAAQRVRQDDAGRD